MLEVPSCKSAGMAPSTTGQSKQQAGVRCSPSSILRIYKSTPVTTCKQFIHIISTIAAHQFTRFSIIIGIPSTA
jgi:hypothetical protein